jgi:hypothetical protein
LFNRSTNLLLTNYSFGKSVRTSTLCMKSNFSNNCWDRSFYCITNSSGSEVYIHQVDCAFTAWKIPENFMALEASDWLKWCQLAYWRCTCGCISRPTYKHSASLLDSMGKENLKKSAKTSEYFFVDLHKSGSSLGAIYKHLKVPLSSVQTIESKYKHHGTTQLSLPLLKIKIL